MLYSIKFAKTSEFFLFDGIPNKLLTIFKKSAKITKEWQEAGTLFPSVYKRGNIHLSKLLMFDTIRALNYAR